MMEAEYDNHREDAPTGFVRWIIPALILSLLLHGYFLYWARGFRLSPTISESYYERVVPRAFHIERVEIDEKLLEPEPSSATERSQAMAPQAIALPQERVAFEKLIADTSGEPSAPAIDHSFLSDKPTVAITTFDAAARLAETSGAKSLLEDSQSLETALLSESPEAGGKTLGNILDPDTLAGRAIVKAGQLRGGDTPGFSNLDDLLAQTGPLTAETAPILMPADLLFDSDQAELQSQAVASLEKLAELIQRNPQATFLIEGHTDSFGPDEYNLALSQRRAEVVKMWLVNVMKTPPDRTETMGLGESRLLVPGTGTSEEQQINRRVEIVIRTRANP
jgi:outer membrane protein OmpA-like peptidoglycan-associated protein